MKNLIFIFLFLISSTLLNGQEQSPAGNLEIAVWNYTSDSLEIMVHPVSMVFNGNYYYSTIAKGQQINGYCTSNRYNYIGGVSYEVCPTPTDTIVSHKYVIPANPNNINVFRGWDFDLDPAGNASAYGEIGFGIYKLIIKNLNTNRVDSCLFEFDYFGSGTTPGDLYIYIQNDNFTPTSGRPYRYYYIFHRNTPPQNNLIEITYDSLENYYLKSWKPNKNLNLNLRPKNFGPQNSFILKKFNDPVLDYYSSIFPLDFRVNSNIQLSTNNFNVNQNHNYPFLNSTYDDRHGILNLNMEIKRRVGTPYSRSFRSMGNSEAQQIVINPGVNLSILRDNYQDNPLQDYPYNGIVLNKYGNENIGNHLIVKGSSVEYNGGTITLGNTFGNDSNNRIVVQSLCKLILESNSNLNLGQKNEINLNDFPNGTQNGGQFIAFKNSIINTGDSSKITVGAYSKFINNGAIINNSNNFQVILSDGGEYILNDNSQDSAIHIFDNGSNMIATNGVLRIGDNSKLIFDGSNSFLEINNNSNIYLGVNSKIVFRNGAYLKSENSNYTSLNNQIWNGIEFENAGNGSLIKNCTFSNSINPIKIVNNSSAAHNEIRIENNTFNLTNNSQNGISAENVFNLLIQDNTINGNNAQNLVYIKNSINPLPQEESPATYNLALVRNNFYGGNRQVYFDCNASGNTPVFVYKNKFNSFTGSLAFIGRKISGNIKSNNFYSPNAGNNIALIQSNVDLYGNTPINATNRNIIISGSSNVNMAPIINNGNYVWTGGYNGLTSASGDNIFNVSNSPYLPIIDIGRNCFIKNSSFSVYHIYADNLSNHTQNPYPAKNNFWSPSPNYSLRTYIDNVPLFLTLNTSSSLSQCNVMTRDNFTTVDRGFGIIDTIETEQIPFSESYPPEVELYGQAEVSKEEGNYAGAINLFKHIIQNYRNTQSSDMSLYSIFECYQFLDTGTTSEYRDILYSDLKNFLTTEINTTEHSMEFDDAAYQFILVCDVNMEKYYDALTGYEFLAQFHPEPETRLLSSYDYAELQAILGTGESVKGSDNSERSLAKLLKKLEKEILSDPVKSKLKEKYETEMISKSEKDGSKSISKSDFTKKGKSEIEKNIYSKRENDFISKSNYILISGRNLSKEELQKNYHKDIYTILGVENTDNNSSSQSELPTEYSLSQNFPNPFNPVTTISYQIPTDGIVNLKVYDILGKEVATLVSEMKRAGSYQVVFNGNNLASGIYFYKIQSGNFNQVKRMMLIK